MKIILLTVLSIVFANLCVSQKFLSPLKSKKSNLRCFKNTFKKFVFFKLYANDIFSNKMHLNNFDVISFKYYNMLIFCFKTIKLKYIF